MALSKEKLKAYNKRLLLSRMRILLSNGFYGLLIMHMILTIDENCKTAATDGNRIYFAPEFLDSLSDDELDYVMIHQILHVALLHCMRDENKDSVLFGIASDIVVNSNILLLNRMNVQSITLKNYGESIHLTPDGEEGFRYTAEEVYDMLKLESKNSSGAGGSQSDNESCNGGGTQEESNSAIGSIKNDSLTNSWDNHGKWRTKENNNFMQDVWAKRIKDAAKAIEIRNSSVSRGILPLFARRILNEMKKPQMDWRTILLDFVQEEVCDYSFCPPDRRFDDMPFYLPAFNDFDFTVADILFMVDTSGSISDNMIATAYSEIKGALDQFDGKLRGWLGFFDETVIKPIPFDSVEDILKIHPIGGGGTDFNIIFEYVHKHMIDKKPASIIILTDGYAPFPKKTFVDDIPVLWIINNSRINPPWGKVVRIKN